MAESNNKMRYGISALDVKYKENALEDELLVDGYNGKMLYKRLSDGQIVTWDNTEYTKEELANRVSKAMIASNITVNTNKNDYVIYKTINISEKTDIQNVNVIDLGIDSRFIVSRDESVFFIRVYGNNTTNAITSFLENYNKSKNENVEKMVTITFDVSDSINDEIVETISATLNFNELSSISLTDITTIENDYVVKVKTVKFSNVDTLINSLDESLLNSLYELNYGNTKFELSSIDFVYYSNDITLPSIYTDDQSKLKYIIPIDTFEDDMVTNSEAVIISEDKPTHQCLWGKVIK